MRTVLEDPTFWVAVAFFIAIAIAAKPLLAMILGALDRRSQEIARTLEEANALNEEAKELLASYRRNLHSSEAEVADIMARAREEADRLARDAARELEERVSHRRQKALDRIEQAEADAVKEVREAAVDLALATTRKLLEDRLTESEQARLVDEAIDEAGRRLH